MARPEMPPLETELRHAVLGPLRETNAVRKAERTLALAASLPVDCQSPISDPGDIPGRPVKPELVSHTSLKAKPMNTPEGRALLLHSIAHIELNAIDLALDVVWRFNGMPEDFYRDWVRIAKEEAKHFLLIQNHLVSLGFDYGHFPAHNSLWDMAERTKGDILARIGLVPRTMEARGLDAVPMIRERFKQIKDVRAVEILEIILRDEIGHVLIGNKWFNFLCEKNNLSAITSYKELARKYRAPILKGPFNIEGRKQAGFTNEELDLLGVD